ncbi:hypothetical protein [Siphonobacter aquaeclarae]|uniref:Uncharacterized protein n=1 Tax=Siphonobacter aquaeclarae TaxID=563176 RepID=A0A1G9IAN5_9BACT|nr:hypothetical protein [Siphonobacter aquaeclarae]SDL22261.1 hypothetical protein SAMN04488090_0400 [Siphonobacter aquaeclarae]
MTYQTPEGDQISGNSPLQILEALRDLAPQTEGIELEDFLTILLKSVRERYATEIADLEPSQVLYDLISIGYLTPIED